MSDKLYTKVGVVSALISSVISGLFIVVAAMISSKAYSLSRENDHMRARIDGWKFSEQLYKQLPGDTDLVERGIKVDKKQGAELSVLGPMTSDRFLAVITSLQPKTHPPETDQEYEVRFTVSGNINYIEIVPSLSDPLPVRAGAMIGPINAGTHEFYLSVDRVAIDAVYLTIARRPLNIQPGSIAFIRGLPFGNMHIGDVWPRPILLSAPEGD